jgi:hypothetical protein
LANPEIPQTAAAGARRIFMFHRIANIIPLPDYKLKAKFFTGENRLYDASQLEKIWPVFRDLTAIPGLFELVRVDMGGNGIVWNENLDLSSEDIWHDGTPIEA